MITTLSLMEEAANCSNSSQIPTYGRINYICVYIYMYIYIYIYIYIYLFIYLLFYQMFILYKGA